MKIIHKHNLIEALNGFWGNPTITRGWFYPELPDFFKINQKSYADASCMLGSFMYFKRVNKTPRTEDVFSVSGEKPKYKFKNTGPVLGVVGGSYSSVSLQVGTQVFLQGTVMVYSHSLVCMASPGSCGRVLLISVLTVGTPVFQQGAVLV